jgi:hypothetical protein
VKTRQIQTAEGETFTVPQGIQRLDSKTTRGWQVRYQGTKYFPDGEATRELLRRVATLPAPVVLKRAPSPRKGSDLPAGISGPILVKSRRSEQPTAVLSVLLPRFGQVNATRKIHIGTRNTYTKARYRAALAKAIELREESVAKYEAAATRARRSAAAAMKKELAAKSRN